jgi:Family of unknown function (DUF5681)
MKRTRINGHALPEKRTPEGRFVPGVSGNPGGRPKGLREFREALEAANVPQLMIDVLLRGLVHEDMEIALAAYDRAAAYLYGRPGAQESIPASMLADSRRLTPEGLAEAQRILMGEEEPTL